jgi:peptidyl-prolyl cis-trans isomerase D
MSDKYNKEEPSLLQKIQNQTGCLLLIIGVAMLAFVLTDLISSGSSIFGGTANNVGEIAGEGVSYEEYNAKYEQLKATVMQNNPGLQMDEMVVQQYRQQAWDIFVQEKVQSKEYEKLGLDVGAGELEDLTIGNNTHPQIQTAFKDPQSGQFNKTRLIQFLKEDIVSNPQARESWLEFQSQFTKGLVTEKYNNLIKSSFYATDLDSRAAIKDENQTINANLVSVAYTTIADSTITVTDAEIAKYLKAHKSTYEQEASRDIEFISLSVVPSAEDSAKMEQIIGQSIEKFQKTTDDSAFVSLMNSDVPFDTTYQIRGSFDPTVEDRIFNAEKGVVIGPFESAGTYSLFKVTGVGTDSLTSVRGSHIFFGIRGGSDADTAATMKEAQELLAKLRRGEANFEQEASTRNYDASKSLGGDLGYIRGQSYAYPQKLVDRLMTSGLNNLFIVQTERGIHIAKATSSPSRKTVQVAVLAQSLYPSTETDGEYYRQAGEFISKLGGEKTFEEIAENMSITKRVASKINERDRRVSGITNGNIVARWLFDDKTDEGDVSTIMDIDDKYIVARCTKIREAGLPEGDEARNLVEILVRNEKKGKILKEKFDAAFEKTQDPEKLAKELGTIVSEIPAASFASGNLPYVGQDPVLVGTIFGTLVGKNSGVVIGKTGVAVVYVKSENQFDMPKLEDKKREMTDMNGQQYAGQIDQILLKIADVKDLRYKFYD